MVGLTGKPVEQQEQSVKQGGTIGKTRSRGRRSGKRVEYKGEADIGKGKGSGRDSYKKLH